MWNKIDLPLFLKTVLCDFVSCRCLVGLWPNDIFAPSGPAWEPKDVQCWTTGAQLAEAQLRIARWHPQCNELLSSTELASNLLCSWHGWHKRWDGILKVGLNYWLKNWRRAVGVSWRNDWRSAPICERFSYTDGLRVLSMKGDHRRLLQEAELVSPFLLEYHCMSLPEY